MINDQRWKNGKLYEVKFRKLKLRSLIIVAGKNNPQSYYNKYRSDRNTILMRRKTVVVLWWKNKMEKRKKAPDLGILLNFSPSYNSSLILYKTISSLRMLHFNVQILVQLSHYHLDVNNGRKLCLSNNNF